MSKLRQDRLSEMIRTLASEKIVILANEYNHEFGIISVIDVVISKDEEYADIYVTSSEQAPDLTRFLAQFAHKIEHSMGREFGLRRSPRIRFRTKKHTKSPIDILSLINSLDKQYGLSEKDSQTSEK